MQLFWYSYCDVSMLLWCCEMYLYWCHYYYVYFLQTVSQSLDQERHFCFRSQRMSSCMWGHHHLCEVVIRCGTSSLSVWSYHQMIYVAIRCVKLSASVDSHLQVCDIVECRLQLRSVFSCGVTYAAVEWLIQV